MHCVLTGRDLEIVLVRAAALFFSLNVVPKVSPLLGDFPGIGNRYRTTPSLKNERRQWLRVTGKSNRSFDENFLNSYNTQTGSQAFFQQKTAQGPQIVEKATTAVQVLFQLVQLELH